MVTAASVDHRARAKERARDKIAKLEAEKARLEQQQVTLKAEFLARQQTRVSV
jgi:hypothetical protein